MNTTETTTSEALQVAPGWRKVLNLVLTALVAFNLPYYIVGMFRPVVPGMVALVGLVLVLVGVALAYKSWAKKSRKEANRITLILLVVLIITMVRPFVFYYY
jgi:hypothetical protein